MRILKDTLSALESNGIIVSVFPTEEAKQNWIENAKKEYEQHYRYAYNYQTWDDNGNAVWHHENERPDWKSNMETYIEKSLTSTSLYYGLWYDSEEVYIKVGDILCKRKVGKSFLVTEEYVQKVIEREQKAYSGKYGEFAIDIQRMFAEKFSNGNVLGYIYPTTYGIGVWVFFNWKKDECIAKVREVLDGMNVGYSNEFSEAGYVYRFRVSKKSENRKRLQTA